MIFQATRCLLLILLLGLFGCDPGPETSQDEQKDSHFLNGRSRSENHDYKGAIEEFEKALEVNPRSASAHFELGYLNAEIKDYAAAIYHYEQHLRLSPTSNYAQRAKDQIRSCKMDMVKNEFLAPVNQGMQRDLERLSAENVLLKRQLEAVQAQLAVRPVTPSNPALSPVLQEAAAALRPPRVTNSEPQAVAASTTRPRVHVVKAGDTITSVAARYHVKLATFMAANPKADPRRLKVGQSLIIPSSSP